VFTSGLVRSATSEEEELTMPHFEEYAERIIQNLPDPTILDLENPDDPDRVWSSIDERRFDTSPLDLNNPNGYVGGLLGSFLDGSSDSRYPEKHETEGAILARGLDALAFYKSIHFRHRHPFPGKWGIFITDYGLRFLAQEISDHYGWNIYKSLTYAMKLLAAHEYYHFQFDAWMISLEGLSNRPLYEEYHANVYRSFFPNDVVVEETLANRRAFQSSELRRISGFVRRFMEAQPGAYARFDEVAMDWNACRAQLGSQGVLGRPGILGHRWEHEPFLARGRGDFVARGECPTYEVFGLRPSHFSPLALPSLQEIRRDFVGRYLNGQRHSRTDHEYYLIDNGERIKIPNAHGQHVRLDEFKSIIRKAGLTPKEYYSERERTAVWSRDCPRSSIRRVGPGVHGR
jgi:hypothetical protein